MSELSTFEARRIAAEWHGGQTTPLYAFASSGAVVPGLDSDVSALARQIDTPQLRALHAYVSSIFKAADRAVIIAGYVDGCNAGAWVIDGNTSHETIVRLHNGLDDGDPEILDSLPSPPSGEWADDPNLEDVVSGILEDAGITLTRDDDETLSDYVRDYMDAYSSGVVDEVEWTAGTYLGVLNPDARPASDVKRRAQMADEHADVTCGS